MTEVAKEFATPDRALHQSSPLEEKKDGSPSVENGHHKSKPPATVTPPENSSRDDSALKDDRKSPIDIVATNHVDSPEDRKVRFNKSESDPAADSPSSTGSQRGLVSRRGGRCGSPGRTSGATSSTKETVLEFKTYRSPPRNQRSSDAVPSLRSDSSPDKEEDETLSKGARSSESLEPAASKAVAGMHKEGTKKGKASERKHAVSFSPVPPPKDTVRTPTKSPTGGRFQSLPVLDDDALRSPGSFFLSPSPATPSTRALKQSGSFDKAESERETATKAESKAAIRQPMRSPKTPRSPRTPRRDDRDRFLTTPTDFTMDYGKHPNSASFESSHVLAWLQSPTANGLFSPGGLGSVLNTPRVAPRTPRTPTVSTSFFFSDVAGLPRSTDTSPKPGVDTKRGGGRGMSNIICISPLASSKTKNGAGASLTPTINYKDMFASPEKSRGMSLLEESPLKGSKSRLEQALANRDPSIDALQMAERELMEDADLSVLLQLASNTPKANGERPVAVSTSDGTNVFRSPQSQKDSENADENLPSLQLPIIGGRENETNATRLARKTHSRDHGDANDSFLAMRSSSTLKEQARSKSKPGDPKHGEKRKETGKVDASGKPPKTGSMYPHHPGYPMPPHPYAHPDAPPYYPPGMPPHGGSMRVVVGGPPQSRSKSSPSRSPHRRPYPLGPGDPNYPPPPYPPPGHYPHHHGVPPGHMHPHYGHYPPPHHPPPRHMPMYGAQHPSSKSKTGKKPLKTTKPSSKRPVVAQVQKPGSAKKQKKGSPSGAPKKKNRSPQLTDKAERQKAAATIQAVNQASGGKNDKAAALAAAILRGVTMRPSGKWQAQLYFAGKSRYIGVFDTREKAALAYEIAREKLKTEKQSAEGGSLNAKATEAAVNAARKAAFEGVNERDPRLSSS